MKIPESIRLELEKIVSELVRVYRPEKIILFGSYAYGRPSADSDLDILIIKKTPDRFIDRWTNVRQIVSDPKRSVPFEPLILTPGELQEEPPKGDQFNEKIVTKGALLYAA